MRVFQLLIALSLFSCTDKDNPEGSATISEGRVEVELEPIKAENFVSRGVTLLPVEANGTYMVECQERNTSDKLGLQNTPSSAWGLPPNTPYAAASYLKVMGNRFMTSIVYYKDAKCDSLSSQTPLLEDERYIALCEYKSLTSSACETVRAIYTQNDPAQVDFLNKLGFCNFYNWKIGVTYDVTDQDCDQSITIDYQDSGTRSFSKELSGNRVGLEVLPAKISYEDNETLVLTRNNGSAIKVKKVDADYVFATIPE